MERYTTAPLDRLVTELTQAEQALKQFQHNQVSFSITVYFIDISVEIYFLGFYRVQREVFSMACRDRLSGRIGIQSTMFKSN